MSSDRQNFIDTVAHRRPRQILYYASFVDDLRRRVIEHIGTDDIGGHYGFFAPAWIGPARPDDLPPLNFDQYWQDEDLPDGTRIRADGVAQRPSGFYHFFGYISPLRHAAELADIQDYPMEDLSAWDFSGMAAQVRAAHRDGRVAIGGIGHMYETAWQIRGYEEFLMDTIDRPEWAACLLERIFQNNLIKATEAAKAGADMLRCGDDVANQNAMMFSLPTWRELMLSRWSKVWAAAKAIKPDIKIWYHSDGNIDRIVPELIDAGVDILNPVQPECVDTDMLHEKYGDRITFDGTIGTQTTMPWGSPDDVRARVREVIEKYGRNGGLMISPTHVLEPEVPLENIDALVEACREFGSR